MLHESISFRIISIYDYIPLRHLFQHASYRFRILPRTRATINSDVDGLRVSEAGRVGYGV